MNTASLLLSMLFGVFGMAYFVYGKKQMKMSALASGAVLCIYPMFISNLLAMVGIGVALVALPFVVDV